MVIKAVIFDLDGTITEPYLDFDVIRKEMGLTKEDGSILDVIKTLPPARRERVESILARHEQEAVDESSLNKGTRRSLETMRKMGLRLGILTRNRKCNALAVLEKHGLDFEVVVGREDGPVKPDAFGVLHICEFFGVEPCETMVVGDYLYDLLCAKEAGAKAVLLAKHADWAQFAVHADFVIEQIDELIDIIEQAGAGL